MPSGNSFNGVAGQGYLVAHGDKLLVPTGRGCRGASNARRASWLSTAVGPVPGPADAGSRASTNGSSRPTRPTIWTAARRVASIWATSTGRSARPPGTPSATRFRLAMPPGELAVTPDWVLVATGTQLKLVERSALWLDGAGENPPRDDFPRPRPTRRAQAPPFYRGRRCPVRWRPDRRGPSSLCRQQGPGQCHSPRRAAESDLDRCGGRNRLRPGCGGWAAVGLHQRGRVVLLCAWQSGYPDQDRRGTGTGPLWRQGSAGGTGRRRDRQDAGCAAGLLF